EEGTGRDRNRDAEHVWIIDPLDGTTNFLHGFPQYCVSIGLAHKGVVTQGVIYDPIRNDLFTATRGRGAFLNDRRMRVSRRAHLRDCLIGTGFPFRDGRYLDTYLQMMKTMVIQSAGLRRPGAAALDLAYVAAGFYDGFFEFGLHPWDVAAGSLLILEAGGLIGDFSGEGDYLHGGQVIAATPKVFVQMISALAPWTATLARESGPDAAVRATVSSRRASPQSLVCRLRARLCARRRRARTRLARRPRRAARARAARACPPDAGRLRRHDGVRHRAAHPSALHRPSAVFEANGRCPVRVRQCRAAVDGWRLARRQ